MTTSKNNNLKNYNEYFDMFFLITSLPNKNSLVTSMSSCMCLILNFSCKFVFVFESFRKYHLFIFLTMYIYVSYSYFSLIVTSNKPSSKAKKASNYVKNCDKLALNVLLIYN